MASWTVSIHQELIYTYTVEAESQKEAESAASDAYLSGDDGNEGGDVLRWWVNDVTVEEGH